MMLGPSFFNIFSDIVNKHAPIKKMRIKNRFSPWFNRDLAELLHLKNSICRKARHTHTQADWLSFRQRRNKCTQAIRKFWKMVHDLENEASSSQLPMSLKVDDMVVTDKKHMAELFNHHFTKSGFLYDSAMPPCLSDISSSPTPSNETIPDASPSFSPVPLQSFSLEAVTESKVLMEHLKLDPKKNIWVRWFRHFLL